MTVILPPGTYSFSRQLILEQSLFAGLPDKPIILRLTGQRVPAKKNIGEELCELFRKRDVVSE